MRQLVCNWCGYVWRGKEEDIPELCPLRDEIEKHPKDAPTTEFSNKWVFIIRFIKSPYPQHEVWDACIGQFEIVPGTWPKKFALDSYHVVARVHKHPRQQWAFRTRRQTCETPLWRYVHYAEQRGFDIDWFFEPVYAIHTVEDRYPVDVKNDWKRREIGGSTA